MKNVESSQLYYRGRQLWDTREKNNMSLAIDYYQQAVELDPNFALAYVGMADVYNLSGLYGYIKPKDAFNKTKEAM